MDYEAINYACNVFLFRIVPVYILGYVSIPLWLGYNFCLTQSTDKAVINVVNYDSNFNLVKFLMAGNSTAYCMFELLMIDLVRDRHSTMFLYFKIFGTVSETLFFLRTRDIVTQQYRYSVLLAVVVRVIELYTYFC